MDLPTLPRRSAFLILLGVPLLGSGCGGPVAQKDLDLGKDSVTAALEAWKKGDKPDSLKQRSPAIEITDDDWTHGLRLIDYQVTKTYGDYDKTVRCAVKLTLQGRVGKQSQREVVYQVLTQPNIVIARD